MKNLQLAIKVDVDTDTGTRKGVHTLQKLFEHFQIPATFFFSVGPDNTGKAIRRIFRKGFLKKVLRTGVPKLYGLKTLLSGTLLPAPLIGARNTPLLQAVAASGFDIALHAYDHFRWQEFLHSMSREHIHDEFQKGADTFFSIFQHLPTAAGAPGWQANEHSLQVYDEASLLWASDTRGTHPFFPRIKGKTFKTLQIPTTLPTLDEQLGLYPATELIPHFLSLLRPNTLEVHTIHAEIEGMHYAPFLEQLLRSCKKAGVTFVSLKREAQKQIRAPVHELIQAPVKGRSGLLACQGRLI